MASGRLRYRGARPDRVDDGVPEHPRVGELWHGHSVIGFDRCDRVDDLLAAVEEELDAEHAGFRVGLGVEVSQGAPLPVAARVASL
jgi:hypothetical protein